MARYDRQIQFFLNYGKVIQFDLTNASFEMTQYDFNPIDSFLVQKQKSVQKCISLDWYYKKVQFWIFQPNF